MPVIDATTDLENLTLTITAEFAAPRTRVWQVYADARKLEQVWGPPGYPATFVDHSLTPGARSTYYMTSPEGQKHCGWWLITDVNEPTSFAFEDGFADEDFNNVEGMATSHCVYSFAEDGGTTTATFVSTFGDLAGLQQVLDMGVVEGATAAINQIDALLAA